VTQLLSAHDVAELSGLSYHAVLRAIRSGELKASKRRGRILIRPEWFDEWIDAGMIEPSGRPALTVADDPAPRRRESPSRRGSLDRLQAIEAAKA
jgi:excisionase family DNA binding protein